MNSVPVKRISTRTRHFPKRACFASGCRVDALHSRVSLAMFGRPAVSGSRVGISSADAMAAPCLVRAQRHLHGPSRSLGCHSKTASMRHFSAGALTCSSHCMLIDGELVQAEQGHVLPVVNPATGEAFDSVPDANYGDLQRAVAAAKRAFATWRLLPFGKRATYVSAFADEILARKEEFARALTAEQGKPIAAARAEISMLVSLCTELADNGDLQPEIILENNRGRAEEIYAPRGVVGAITPWNFPVSMAANKMLPALITGNTVVLKPSPYTPISTIMLSKVAAEVFPRGVLNILTGGNELGQWIVSHPDVKHITFTGSSATGKSIMAAAAVQLKKLTLELGGNDPAILLPNSNVKEFAPRLFKAAMFNTGQVCTAVKRVYVHESQYNEWTDALAAEAGMARLGDGMSKETQYGPLNNKAQLEHVETLVSDARQRGARIVAGGHRVQPTGKPHAYFFEPTIVADVDDTYRIVREEQFGPVLPILKYQTVEEAVQRANDTDYGLGGSVWGSDAAEAAQVAVGLESGNVWINTHMNSGMGINAPFGGIKSSGLGREKGGKVGLKEFVDIKVAYIPKSVA